METKLTGECFDAPMGYRSMEHMTEKLWTTKMTPAKQLTNVEEEMLKIGINYCIFRRSVEYPSRANYDEWRVYTAVLACDRMFDDECCNVPDDPCYIPLNDFTIRGALAEIDDALCTLDEWMFNCEDDPDGYEPDEWYTRALRKAICEILPRIERNCRKYGIDADSLIQRPQSSILIKIFSEKKAVKS